MATARSAAMAFNRLVDRRIDALNPRTASRHLPAGRLSVGRGRGLHGWPVRSRSWPRPLLFLPNRWPLLLSVPVLLWLLGYSYTKRFTSLAHFWLGVVADAGADGRLDRAPGRPRLASGAAGPGGPLLGLGLRHHLRLPGRRPSIAGSACTASPAASASRVPCGWRRPAMPLMIVALRRPRAGRIRWAGSTSSASPRRPPCSIYEHALVRPDDLTRVNVAFFQVNIAISVGLLAVGVADLILS